MKICWDNLEGLRYDKNTGKWYKGVGNTTYLYKESCKNCGEPFLAQPHTKGIYCCNRCQQHNEPSFKGKSLSDDDKEKIRIRSLKRFEDPSNHPSWKGGYASNNIPTYDLYALRLEWCEEVRRNNDDHNILEVKCAYCGKWYIPSVQNVVDRIRCINGLNNSNWEGRFYCSKQCKQECPIFKKVKFPKDFKMATSREVQPQLRQIVFERDNYECQKCWSVGPLHCHHITGVELNPIESADVDNCITLCKKCHKEVHSQNGCKYNDMKRRNC
jgi:hypothetical protein